ncbi:MAG: hypothetical protein EYC67_03425 [Betaproteobacteria bacterium]|nr:MAG: hypothetical protein EYC67_03425 [Betaproteobacteria bacterium]
MLSITDLRDFIDLDHETVHVVISATRQAPDRAVEFARQLLASRSGVTTLHHMFRDQIAEAEARRDHAREGELRRAYAYFARKYPIPQLN